jgi:hypothetical protein
LLGRSAQSEPISDTSARYSGDRTVPSDNGILRMERASRSPATKPIADGGGSGRALLRRAWRVPGAPPISRGAALDGLSNRARAARAGHWTRLQKDLSDGRADVHSLLDEVGLVLEAEAADCFGRDITAATMSTAAARQFAAHLWRQRGSSPPTCRTALCA